MVKLSNSPMPAAAQAPPDAEATLVREAQADRAAFGALYDRYIDVIYGYAFRQSGDHVAAQDITAETFRRALERIGDYTWQGKPFGAWLVRIAGYVIQERRRAQRSDSAQTAEMPAADLLSNEDVSALDGLIAHEDASILWDLVRMLPPDYQQVIVLRFARELDYAAIASTLRRSPAACKQLAYRALQALRPLAVAAGEWPERGDGHAV